MYRGPRFPGPVSASEAMVASQTPLAFVPTCTAEDFRAPRRLTVDSGGVPGGPSHVHSHFFVLFPLRRRQRPPLRCVAGAQSRADPPTHARWSRFAGAQVPCESPVPLLSHALSPVPLYFLGSELPAFSKWIALMRLPGMVFLGSSARDVSLFALKDQMPPHAGALP